MRRVLSITLLLLFMLPSFAASLLQNTSTNVPVCCRAKGKHHCMMMVPETVSRGGVSISFVREKCPAFPKSTAWANSQLTVPQAQSGIAAIVTSPNAILQAEAHYRIAWSRSRQKRGPPSFLS